MQIVVFALRGEPDWDRQQSEYGHCGNARQDFGLHAFLLRNLWWRRLKLAGVRGR
jgi:hypothetical protein